jgi:glycosyltransferase involved in cell wall biosynthesis
LATVKPLIDHWVIVDTGSTDGTQEIIKEFMKDIPGELYERPWVDFAHNRNQALQLAKDEADYILFIDADEIFSYSPGFVLPQLNKDFYHFYTEYGGTKYCRVQLVRSRLNWAWVGVLHEALHSTEARSNEILTGITNVVNTDGARSQDPQKYQKDAQVLEAALKKEPNNSRYAFYLAQSYKDAQDFTSALKNYKKRVAMGGWDQEVFWSLLQIGQLQEARDMPAATIIDSYKHAQSYRPSRLEPTYRLASYYRRQGNYLDGYLVAERGLNMPLSNDILFVEKWIYDYGLLLEFSICAYWTERYTQALLASYLILAKPSIPEDVRECVEKNIYWANLKIKESAERRSQTPKIVHRGPPMLLPDF